MERQAASNRRKKAKHQGRDTPPNNVSLAQQGNGQIDSQPTEPGHEPRIEPFPEIKPDNPPEITPERRPEVKPERPPEIIPERRPEIQPGQMPPDIEPTRH